MRVAVVRPGSFPQVNFLCSFFLRRAQRARNFWVEMTITFKYESRGTGCPACLYARNTGDQLTANCPACHSRIPRPAPLRLSCPFRAGDGRIRSRPRALPWATMSRPFRAHDGGGFPFPRALPWATMSRPFRAHVARYILPNTPMSRPFRAGDGRIRSRPRALPWATMSRPFRAHVARYILPNTPMSRPFRAHNGDGFPFPRALPWAAMSRPFRAHFVRRVLYIQYDAFCTFSLLAATPMSRPFIAHVTGDIFNPFSGSRTKQIQLHAPKEQDMTAQGNALGYGQT